MRSANDQKISSWTKICLNYQESWKFIPILCLSTNDHSWNSILARMYRVIWGHSRSYWIKSVPSQKLFKLWLRFKFDLFFFSKHTYQVIKGHTRSKIPKKGQILVFIEIRFSPMKKNREKNMNSKYSLTKNAFKNYS